MIDRHGLGEQHDTAFGSTIGDSCISTGYSPTRAVIDDDTFALRDHAGQSEFRHEERALQIYVDLQVPLFLAAIKGGVRVEHTGVVEQNVEFGKGG